MNTLRLADLKPGQSGIVTAVSGNGRLSCRLMEMGLVPGVTVQVLRKAPFGDPVQYRVRGVVISMRSAEAAGVSVCVESAGLEFGHARSSVLAAGLASAAG